MAEEKAKEDPPTFVKEMLVFSVPDEVQFSHKSKHAQESAWGRIKAVITDTGLESTAHGIPNMISNTMWSFKLMWIVCFLGSCGGCAYLLYKSTNEYLDYDVVTTVHKISETPTKFPTISICNTNLIVNQKSFDYVRGMLMADLRALEKSLTYYDYTR
jgi:hypothetical protein